MDTVTDMKMESETTVSTDPTTKDTIIDVKVTRMEMDVQSGTVHITCDTNLENDPTNEVCAPFYDILNGPSHFELDENGDLVEATGNGADLQKAMAKSAQDSKSDSALSPSKQWAETSRVLLLLSNDNVKPGDTWDSSVDYGDMGHFDGTTTLLGYRTIDGEDCAVFSTVGKMTIDVDTMVDALFSDSPMKSLMKDVTMDNYTMEAMFYYQYDTNLVRYSKTTQSFVMNMPNPLGKGTTSVPITQDIITSARIKE
jgi:Family of unknown function (DUF6263)